MWCMTLKCRTAVPGDRSRSAVRFSYQRPTATPSISRTKERPNSDRMPSKTLFSRLAERFFDTVMRPVPINQRRHPKVDLPLDIEMPVFIADRHLLPFDLSAPVHTRHGPAGFCFVPPSRQRTSNTPSDFL